MLTYEDGYRDGESSVHADIVCFISEELGLGDHDGYSEPLRALKAERDRFREALEQAEMGLAYTDATPIDQPNIREVHLDTAREAIRKALHGA